MQVSIVDSEYWESCQTPFKNNFKIKEKLLEQSSSRTTVSVKFQDHPLEEVDAIHGYKSKTNIGLRFLRVLERNWEIFSKQNILLPFLHIILRYKNTIRRIQEWEFIVYFFLLMPLQHWLLILFIYESEKING